jgi:hypothetical protein
LREQSQIAGEVQLVMLKGGLESGDELAAKHTTEYLDGEKEVRTGSNPASVIERESTGGNNAVNMGMKPSTPTIPRARKIRMSKSSIHSTRSMVLAFKSSAGRSVETARCLSPIQLGGG